MGSAVTLSERDVLGAAPEPGTRRVYIALLWWWWAVPGSGHLQEGSISCYPCALSSRHGAEVTVWRRYLGHVTGKNDTYDDTQSTFSICCGHLHGGRAKAMHRCPSRCGERGRPRLWACVDEAAGNEPCFGIDGALLDAKLGLSEGCCGSYTRTKPEWCPRCPLPLCGDSRGLVTESITISSLPPW
jgi:hypothetical protein